MALPSWGGESEAGNGCGIDCSKPQVQRYGENIRGLARGVVPYTMSESSFLVKVVALSAAMGVGIKYLLPALPLALEPSLGLAVGLLLAPSLLMAVLLWGWSASRRPPSGT